MLTALGLPVLRWIYEVALPEAYDTLDQFADYVDRWSRLLEGDQ